MRGFNTYTYCLLILFLFCQSHFVAKPIFSLDCVLNGKEILGRQQDLRGRGVRAAAAATTTVAAATAVPVAAATAVTAAAAAAPLPQRRRLQRGTKSAASGMSWND